MGAAFCDRIRFCSSSSGARLIGPCTIERARAVARRTRDNSSNSSGPKTSKTIIANENHSLIAPHFFAGLAQKKPARSSGDKVCGSRPAASGQVRRVRVLVHIFLRWAVKFHWSVQSVQDCPRIAPWRTSGEFEILGAIMSGHSCARCIQSRSAPPRANPMER